MSPRNARAAAVRDMPRQPCKSTILSPVELSNALCRLLGASDGGAGNGGGVVNVIAPVVGGRQFVCHSWDRGGKMAELLEGYGIWFSVLRFLSRGQLRLRRRWTVRLKLRGLGGPPLR